MRHARPTVALVLAHPQAAGGGAEGEPLARLIECERVAVHHVVGVRLRQASGEDLEALTAVARARDGELALVRDALLVLDLWNEPRGFGIVRVHDDRKAEGRRYDVANFGEGLAF